MAADDDARAVEADQPPDVESPGGTVNRHVCPAGTNCPFVPADEPANVTPPADPPRRAAVDDGAGIDAGQHPHIGGILRTRNPDIGQVKVANGGLLQDPAQQPARSRGTQLHVRDRVVGAIQRTTEPRRQHRRPDNARTVDIRSELVRCLRTLHDQAQVQHRSDQKRVRLRSLSGQIKRTLGSQDRIAPARGHDPQVGGAVLRTPGEIPPDETGLLLHLGIGQSDIVRCCRIGRLRITKVIGVCNCACAAANTHLPTGPIHDTVASRHHPVVLTGARDASHG